MVNYLCHGFRCTDAQLNSFAKEYKDDDGYMKFGYEQYGTIRFLDDEVRCYIGILFSGGTVGEEFELPTDEEKEDFLKMIEKVIPEARSLKMCYYTF